MNNFLRKRLGVTTEIKMVQRIHESIYILELNNWEGKQKKVIENEKKLIDLKDIKVVIYSDLTRNKQKIQIWIEEMARKKNSAGSDVKAGFNKLCINVESGYGRERLVASKNGVWIKYKMKCGE